MSFSRASTVTLGHGSGPTRDRANALDRTEPEYIPDRLLDSVDDSAPQKRLIVAVDFGTTFSAVAYAALEEGEDASDLDPSRIHTVQNHPDDTNVSGLDDQMRSEVPTEVIYPLDRHFRKKAGLYAGGNDIRMDDEADPETPFGDAPFGMHGGLAAFGNHSMYDADPMSIEEETTTFRWGYEAHEAWGRSAAHTDPNSKPLARFKLLLDSTERTEAIRMRLNETLTELKRRKVIKHPLDVIVDFLTCLLRHAKTEIQNAGYDESYKREMVMCVPAIWTQKACRDMQSAMAKAMMLAGFPGVDAEDNIIENLFIVSEPEAAAAFVLEEERGISPGDTFLLLDAGGGTVDANTYTVSTATPLRLTREVVDPGGGLHGSSYINQGFRTLLEDLLADETYLNTEESTIQSCIEKIIINEFEYRVKRTFDCYKASENPKLFKFFDIPGLRANPEKGFRRGSVRIRLYKIVEIFSEHLEGIARIMEEQMLAALEKEVKVEKVILIGGFAGSISLHRFLREHLEQFCASRNLPVPALLPPLTEYGSTPQHTATAVARGAVLRALNKENGPRRQARTSYGIWRSEEYGAFPEHAEAKKSYDKHDGLEYAAGTIDWVLKLGQEVPSVWRSPSFLCNHTFDCFPRRPLICKELLYASDHATESHYQLHHPKNAGAELIGEIIVDFTFLRTSGRIRPVDGGTDATGKRKGKRHYKVTYTMVIRVVDRDLQCYAVYDGRIMTKCKINIASAFRPGVK
ncbi:hypothetical protein QBC34DRAFT_23733 [Podospora aff. communis PSN243]|uniref:Uncharacterized protein n=1 Tax=Podospora aff. communis PSN243 TaxID=3040156 RepID=A0AAV9G0Y1_9PEZI|nr:hypothetical protein QBC34DRAFT_23733 [Podospora aff. communis PSN243]